MAIEVFNRVENKYLIDVATYIRVLKEIEPYMKSDPYNVGGKAYTISNLYYDTADHQLIRNSLDKPLYKEKLRLRAYGVPEHDSKVFLELKKKYKGVVNKRRTTLTYDEAIGFLESRELPNLQSYMNEQVLKEMTAFLKRFPVCPAVYIAYDRFAYFCKTDASLRISFDTNIRTRRADLDLTLGDCGKLLLDRDVRLMEIKASGSYPLWLTKILSKYNIRRVSFSKYGTEYKNHCSGKLDKEKIKEQKLKEQKLFCILMQSMQPIECN